MFRKHKCLHYYIIDMGQCARINDTTGDVMLCRKRHVALYTLNGALLLNQDVCAEGDDHVVSCAFYEGTGNEWLERSILFTGHIQGCVKVSVLLLESIAQANFGKIWSKAIRQGKFVLDLVKRLDHVDQSSERGLNVTSAITCILPMPQTVYTGDEDGRVVSQVQSMQWRDYSLTIFLVSMGLHTETSCLDSRSGF